MTQHNITIGARGEALAVDYLLENGFQILEKNWRFQHKEVDIICAKADILHFVEVKTRTNTKFGLPESSVSVAKMKYLKDAAEQFQLEFPEWQKIQFDVIAILLNGENVKELYVNWDVYF